MRTKSFSNITGAKTTNNSAIATLIVVATAIICIITTLPLAIAQTYVSVNELGYTPNVLSVTVGTTVTWKNDAIKQHTVTSGIPNSTTSGQMFDSNLQSQQSFSYIFNVPGLFDYYDRFNPESHGEVRVS
jgi:plastocyanin